MKTQCNFERITNFFTNAFINKEVSPLEVEIFLQEYLKFIFDLNKIDLSRYIIHISKADLNTAHIRRAHEFKNDCNAESRKTKKIECLLKPAHSSYCADHYFDAFLQPSRTVMNEYTIWINRDCCRARNECEINQLLYLFHVFGHEVHHIIQYIRHVKEMNNYDYLQQLNDINIKNTDKIASPRESRKLKRKLNQHLTALEYLTISERYADKKGYDYLDILINKLIEAVPMFNDTARSFLETDTDYKKNKDAKALRFYDEFLEFLYNCQESNECFYDDRFLSYAEQEKINTKVCADLKEYYSEEELAID